MLLVGEDTPMLAIEDFAMELGRSFKVQLKAKNVYSRFLKPGVTLRMSRWWPYFLRAATICKQIEKEDGIVVSPDHYVRAVFDSFAWKRNLLPMPPNLCSDRAVAYFAERYRRYAALDIMREMAKTVMIHDPFKREDRKLASLSQQFGTSYKRTLKMCRSQFSDAFVRRYGVYEEGRGED